MKMWQKIKKLEDNTDVQCREREREREQGKIYILY